MAEQGFAISPLSSDGLIRNGMSDTLLRAAYGGTPHAHLVSGKPLKQQNMIEKGLFQDCCPFCACVCERTTVLVAVLFTSLDDPSDCTRRLTCP